MGFIKELGPVCVFYLNVHGFVKICGSLLIS